MSPSKRGFSLVEVLVGATLIILIFGGIIGAFRSVLVLVGHARATSGALSLANERIERLRSLPYDEVGTVGGIPSGAIAQNETVTVNGVVYTRRTLIQYFDAPEDGLGTSDGNGIAADYKRAKVMVSWSVRGSSKSLSLVTNVIPKGIETVAGGGTLVVNVFDAAAQPVSNALVRVVNASTTAPIDVSAYTNEDGVIMFPGAPAGAGYQISASRNGYSSDQTYSASSSNPNPNPPHVAVIVGGVSTVNFAIDRVSSRTLVTVASPQSATTTDSFNDSLKIASSTGTIVAAGELILTGGPSTYVGSGRATSTIISPSGLMSWDAITWAGISPAGSTSTMRVFGIATSTGNYVLLPESSVPGNAIGFPLGRVNLSNVSATTYPSLALSLSLTSTNASTTPRVSDWNVSYVSSSAISNVQVILRGTKNIGTNTSGQPIFKYQQSLTTNAFGVTNVTNLQWDQYKISLPTGSSYDVGGVCAPSSLQVSPGTSATTTVVLVPHTTNSFLIKVTTASGAPVVGATVRIDDGTTVVTKITSACGYVYAGSLVSSRVYDIDIAATGYTSDTISNISPSGQTEVNVMLIP